MKRIRKTVAAWLLVQLLKYVVELNLLHWFVPFDLCATHTARIKMNDQHELEIMCWSDQVCLTHWNTSAVSTLSSIRYEGKCIRSLFNLLEEQYKKRSEPDA